MDSKNKIIIPILVVLLIAAGYFVVSRYILTDSGVGEEGVEDDLLTDFDVNKFKPKSLDTEIFSSKKFIDLKDDNVGLNSVNRIKTGKKNPFSG